MTNSSSPPSRRYHDMGGLHTGPVHRTEHDYALWERRVDAIMMLLSHPSRGLLRVDELRRGIESLDPDVYDTMSYYERWATSIATIMIEKGIVSEDELEARARTMKKEGRVPS